MRKQRHAAAPGLRGETLRQRPGDASASIHIKDRKSRTRKRAGFFHTSIVTPVDSFSLDATTAVIGGVQYLVWAHRRS